MGGGAPPSHACLGSWGDSEGNPGTPPRPRTPRTKAPRPGPQAAGPGGGRGGARSSRARRKLPRPARRKTRSRSARNGAEPSGPSPLPRPFRARSLRPLRPRGPGTRLCAGWEGVSARGPPLGPRRPLPSRAGPPPLLRLAFPLPLSGQWPRRLDTPSPRPASRFLRQTKRDPRRGRSGGCGGTPTLAPGVLAGGGGSGVRGPTVCLGARGGGAERSASWAWPGGPSGQDQAGPSAHSGLSHAALGHTLRRCKCALLADPACTDTACTRLPTCTPRARTRTHTYGMRAHTHIRHACTHGQG